MGRGTRSGRASESGWKTSVISLEEASAISSPDSAVAVADVAGPVRKGAPTFRLS